MKKFLATQYTIACHGMDPAVLQKTVTKHCEHFPLYLSKKPIAAHNKEAYANLQKQLAGNVNPLILDRYEQDFFWVQK